MKNYHQLATPILPSITPFPFYDESFMESFSVWASPNDELQLTVENFVLTVVYSAIFLAGVFGNFLTAYVVIKKPHMKTITNRLIFNLALSDSFFMLCLPFVVVTSIERSWVFGGIMCKAFYAINCVNIFAGSFTLAILSADRYVAVCHSVYAIKHRSPMRAMVAIILSWLLSCIATLPAIWYAVVVDRDSIETDDEDYEDEYVNYPYLYDRFNQSYYISYMDGFSYSEQAQNYFFPEYRSYWREGDDYQVNNLTAIHQPNNDFIPNKIVQNNFDYNSWTNQTNNYFPKQKSLTCSVNFPSHEAYPLKFAYVIYSAIVGFILPMITIIVFYTLLVMRLASTTNKVNRKPAQDIIHQNTERKMPDPKPTPNNPMTATKRSMIKEQLLKQRKASPILKSISTPDIPAFIWTSYDFKHTKQINQFSRFKQHPSSTLYNQTMNSRSSDLKHYQDKLSLVPYLSKSSDNAMEADSKPTFLKLNDILFKIKTKQIIPICQAKKFEKHLENVDLRNSMMRINSAKGLETTFERRIAFHSESRTPTNNPTVSSDKCSGPFYPVPNNEIANNSSQPSTSKDQEHPRGSQKKKKRNKLVSMNSGRRHRKVTRLVTAVIIVYIACWLPYYAFQLQLLVDPRTVAKNPWTMYLYYIVTTLTYLHSVFNPILYALTNKNFQDAFKDTFKCCPLQERK